MVPSSGRAVLGVLLIALAGLAQAQSPAPPAPSPRTGDRGSATDERLRRVRERRLSIERDLARLRGQEKSLLAEVERLDLEVRLRTEQLRETQIVLHRANEQMDATVRRLKDLEASVAQARPQLAARARALYKMGELSYVRMLLSVERPSDMFRGYRFVSRPRPPGPREDGGPARRPRRARHHARATSRRGHAKR